MEEALERRGAWGPTSNGLRARLVVASPAIARAGHFAIEMEVENVGGAPATIPADDPLGFEWTLRDSAANTLRSTEGRMEVLSSMRLETIAPGSTRRISVSIRGVDGAASANLDVTTAVWRLAPGRYTLAARYTQSAARGATGAGAWTGTLELPPVALQVQ